MDSNFKLALENWRNEHERLQGRFRMLREKNKVQAQDIRLYMQKVRQKIRQSEDRLSKED